MNGNKSVTLIFGAYYSHKHIYRTCKKLNKKFKIIVVENSLDKKFKQDIEKKYKNTKVIIPEKNVIKWKMSKTLFNRLNKNFTETQISDIH